MSNEALLILMLALPFVGSAVAGALPETTWNAEAWLAGIVALAGFGLALGLYPEMANGEVLRLRAEWLPTSGLEFSLRMDGFAWMFSLLVTGMGFLVVLYAR